MANTVHLLETLVRAPRETVWEALVDPAMTERYFFGAGIESTFTSGAGYRYVSSGDGRPFAGGEIEVFEPPHRLVMTFRLLRDAALEAEPPSRVEWTLTPACADGSVTRVRVRHGDLALSPLTWARLRDGWTVITSGLKSLLETGESLAATDLADTSDAVTVADVEGDWHRAQGVDANNSVWELLDGRELDAAGADDLLQRAYAAAYHWERATGATAVNRTRASWLVSRAHAVLGHGELALHHADRSAAHLAEAGADAADFDHAYAYEARARALACLGRLDEARDACAAAAAIPIADDQDREIVESDLASEPWFGLGAD